MSERLKPNFTAVPNVIFDEIIRKLPPGAAKVLFAICRFTYGYGKPNGDRISLQQLQDMTGMARGSVARSLKDLGALIAVKHGDPSRQLASEYRIDVEISDGELVSLCDQGLVSKRDQASLLASRIKRPSEETQRKKKPSDSFFPIIEKIIHSVNKLSGRAYRADTKAVCKYLRARLKGGATEADCLAVVEDRWAKWGNSEKMREHFNPVTLFRDENFARYLAEANARGNGAITGEERERQRREMFINA